jgi:putative ABC transport system permease protein
MTLDSLWVALRALLANRLRSALTMLGILMGTAAVILLVAVGAGISNNVQGQIGKLGTNALYVLNERTTGGQDRGGTEARQIRLTPEDVKALEDKARAPSVARVTPGVSAPGTLTWNGFTYPLQTFLGVAPAFGEIRNLGLQEGRWLTDEDQAAHAKLAVIGTTVVDHVFGHGVDPVGRTVSFNNVEFKIVGLLQHRGSNGTTDQDDVMYAPLSTVIEDVVGDINSLSFSVIAVQATSRDAITPAASEITAVLRQTHGIAPEMPPDFRVVNAADLLAAGKATARSFRILLAIVAAISLAIGGVGVMNIMLVTVTERTREIGIRKALGAHTGDILAQFLTESVLLSGIGGFIGTVVGVGVGQLRIAAVQPQVAPSSVALSFGVSVLIGIFFGAYPASRAAGLTPIVALRYE